MFVYVLNKYFHSLIRMRTSESKSNCYVYETLMICRVVDNCESTQTYIQNSVKNARLVEMNI